MIKCPYCVKDIGDKVIKCPHCGEILRIFNYWFKLRNFVPFIIFFIPIVTLIITSSSSCNQIKSNTEQLRQNRINSAIVNRPYVEIRPIVFKSNGIKDVFDPTSIFYNLFLEMKNYSDIPATNVVIQDYKIGSKSRGFLTPDNFSMNFKNICVFPKSSFIVRTGFVMNPNYHIRMYDEGKEDFEIYLKITYEGIKDAKDKTRHWYSCNWKYSLKSLSIINSETDLVK